MTMSSRARTLLTMCMLLVLAGCTGQSSREFTDGLTRADLLNGSKFGVANDDDWQTDNILALNNEMREFLAAHVPENLGSRRKVELILAAILDDGLRLDYNLFKTYTAREAFYTREGNCMSFTNLFVALARETGVSANYQEVEVPPSWEARGDTWFFNKHVNALVDLPGGSITIDFSLESNNSAYRHSMVSDRDAQARYHNNMGVHWMAENDYANSFRHFRQALELQPKTAYFWTNLGTLYRRSNHPQEAKASYLEALAESAEPAAMSNLARMYRAEGQDEIARWYEAKVQLFRRKNPFYLFHLAEEAYAGGDYPKAVTEARAAIRRQKGVHEFHHLLGLSYVQLGELDHAEEQFVLAAELAADSKQRENYNRKLELIAKH